jgi:tungstate transport system substrate-binding protein
MILFDHQARELIRFLKEASDMKRRTKWLTCSFSLIFLLLSVSASFSEDACKAVYGSGTHRFTAATGSPGELGLLKALAKAFNQKHDTSICWIKAGSGKSLNLLKGKTVDVVMVHAPAAEKEAVKKGWAVKRTLIGSNEFYLVGPKNDPAGIAGAKNAADAYAGIARVRATFISRGDYSGTHKKEMAIWKKAGLVPSGDWYITTKDFMMATLKKANDLKGYFMTDSSTWVAGKRNLRSLRVIFRGDPMLINTYHGLCQPEGATPGQAYGCMFIDFLASGEGQGIIQDYGKELYGEAMYNDAEYAKRYDQ